MKPYLGIFNMLNWRHFVKSLKTIVYSQVYSFQWSYYACLNLNYHAVTSDFVNCFRYQFIFFFFFSLATPLANLLAWTFPSQSNLHSKWKTFDCECFGRLLWQIYKFVKLSVPQAEMIYRPGGYASDSFIKQKIKKPENEESSKLRLGNFHRVSFQRGAAIKGGRGDHIFFCNSRTWESRPGNGGKC